MSLDTLLIDGALGFGIWLLLSVIIRFHNINYCFKLWSNAVKDEKIVSFMRNKSSVEDCRPILLSEYSAMKVFWLPVSYLAMLIMIALVLYTNFGYQFDGNVFTTYGSIMTVATVIVKGLFYTAPVELVELGNDLKAAAEKFAIEMYQEQKRLQEELCKELESIHAKLLAESERLAKSESNTTN